MAEGLVARLGRRCFRRRWWVLAIWLLAVGGGVLSVGPVFHGLAGGGGPSSLESVQANQMLADAGRKGATVTAVVDGIDPTAAAVHDAVLAAVVSAASVMTVLLLFAQFTDLDNNAVTVVSLLALGLSIDYGLLLVGRYREELGGGHEPDVAIARAWATAGRTILFSALTVAAAMSGLLLFGITGLSALGAAGVSIALVAMLVSLTLSAALVGLGRRWIKPSRRAARRIARYGDAAEVGFFARLARIVQRRPWITVLATGAALVGAGAPLLATGMHLDDVNSLPRSLEAVTIAHELADRFNVATAPAVVVVARTDPETLDAWATRWSGTAGVSRVAPAEQVGPGVAMVDIDVAGDPESATARTLVDQVRADRPVAQSWVTGDAAFLNDLLGLLEQRLPWAIGVTVLAMVVLLFAMTGSLVVPRKAVVMNAHSLAATVGG